MRASEILSENQIKRIPEVLYQYRLYGGNKSIEGIEESKKSACTAIKKSLKRKEGINANVFWSHMTGDEYNYFDWREINETLRSTRT